MIYGLVKKIKRESLASNKKIYLLLDWTASGLAFLNTWYIYRSASNLRELGKSGWLLNLLLTSLFISGAAQYFSMFRSKGTFNTYIAFFPILVLEIIGLRFVVGGFYHLLISVSLLANVLFASFRGHLLGTEKMPQAALCNISEQGLRFIAIFVLIQMNVRLDIALLLNNVIAYIISTMAVLIYIIYHKQYEKIDINYKSFMETFWYSIIHILIYILMSGDVLALRQVSAVGEFVLIKPWGQILIVMLMPLINIYLVNLKNKEKTKSILYMIAGIFTIYSVVGLVAGDYISRLVFGFSVSTTYYILAVVVEHFFVAFILVVVYKVLYENSYNLRVILSVIAGIIFIFVTAALDVGNYVFIIYPVVYSQVLFINIRGFIPKT